MAQKTLLAIAILAMAGAANAQTARDEFNSNTNSAPSAQDCYKSASLAEQLKEIDLRTQYNNCVLDCHNKSTTARDDSDCVNTCGERKNHAWREALKQENEANAACAKAQLIQREQRAAGSGGAVQPGTNQPPTLANPNFVPGSVADIGKNRGNIPPLQARIPKMAPTPPPLMGYVSKSAPRDRGSLVPERPSAAPIQSTPLQGGVAKNSLGSSASKGPDATRGPNGEPAFNPRHPQLWDWVPPKFSPTRLPAGVYVAKGPGDGDHGGYIRPIENCTPDSAPDLAIAGAARGIAGACTSFLGIGARSSLPILAPEEEMVWVNIRNTGERIIWRQGTKWAGNTVKGNWTTLSKALKSGARLPKPNPTGLSW